MIACREMLSATSLFSARSDILLVGAFFPLALLGSLRFFPQDGVHSTVSAGVRALQLRDEERGKACVADRHYGAARTPYDAAQIVF